MSEGRVPALGTVIAGRYRLLRLVGEGAMGAIFESERLGDARRVAVKVLFRDLAPVASGGGALARFLREAQVSAAIVHPNVVPVTDGGVDSENGVAFLVMDLLAGEDLEGLLERTGPLVPEVAVRVILQAANGLAAAHAQGIIHRDIKPSNLFLHHEGNQVIVKVCDFGVAKAATGDQQGTDLTRTGHMLGSPVYMAPEQFFNSKRVDVRADVWSLGMTLYEALAGMGALAAARSFTELIDLVSRASFPHIQDPAPWVPGDLATVLHGTLVADPDKRCPTVEAFADALRPFVGSSERLTLEDLEPMPNTRRMQREERAAPVSVWRASASVGPAPAQGDPLLGKRLGGRYHLLQLLGEGAMGAVYEAEAPDGTRVAVKVILPEGGAGSSRSAGREEAAARFVREARAVMSIKSPNVVRVLEADRDATLDLQYLVMELLSGTDLDKLIRQVGPLDPRVVACLFRQAAQGLATAHALGIIHRDIKPANIFLHEQPNGEVVAKICDFGIAKQLTGFEGKQSAHDLTRTGGLLGSPMYLSPEQARNAKDVDHRADIWSLCISMHEALSGRKPWHGAGNLADLILAICSTAPTNVQDAAPWVPPGLALAVHRGILRDKAARWSSVSELAAALAPFATPHVTRAQLAAPTLEVRSLAQPRADLGAMTASGGAAPGGGATDASALAKSVADAAPPRTTRSPLLWILPLPVVAAVVTVVVIQSQRPVAVPLGPPSAPARAEATPPTTTTTPTTAPTIAPITKVKALFLVRPPTAKVTVNGQEQPITEAGELTLSGEPGEAFEIVASLGVGATTARAVLSRDGTVTPSEVRVLIGGARPKAPTDKPAAAPDKPAAPATPPAGAPKPRAEF